MCCQAWRRVLNLRCQELGVVLSSDLSLKVLSRKMELVALWCLVAECLSLLVQKLERVVLGHLLALGSLDVVPGPLPQLTS